MFKAIYKLKNYFQIQLILKNYLQSRLFLFNFISSYLVKSIYSLSWIMELLLLVSQSISSISRNLAVV